MPERNKRLVCIGSQDIEEAQRNATIAQAVLPEFDYVCRIDVATKSYVFYYADDIHTIVPQHVGDDYEKIMTEFNRAHVVPEECEALSRNMRLDNLIRQLEQAPDYVLYATSFDQKGLAYKKFRFCYADSSKKDILLSRSDVSSVVKEKLKLTEELLRSQAEMKHVLETTTELMFQYDPSADELRLNKAQMGGDDRVFARRELLDFLIDNGWLEPSHRDTLDGCLVRMRDGESHCSATIQAKRAPEDQGWTWYRVTLFDYQDEYAHERKVLGYLQNVDKDMLQQARLRRQAQTDALTGLLNVGEGKKQVNALLEAQGEDPAGYNAMFLLDIDDFKTINDTRGHMTGDTALTQLAQALSHTFRARDVVYRMGGDEFIVFMEELLAPEQDLPAILERFQQQLEHARRRCPFLQVSVGIYVTNRPHPYEHYYAEADRALYQTKSNGKNHYTILRDET